MHEHEWLAERFEENRSYLRAVAYRMLGSLSEADDAVQEAWLRLSRSDTSGVENLVGWLTTVVARICLDMLRSRKARPEDSVGTQVPDALGNREDGIDPAALHAFADRLARGEAEEAYRAVEELVAQLLARVAGAAAGRTAGVDETREGAVLRRLGERAPAARWAELRDEIGRSFARTDALNLDKKQTILGAFFAIAGFAIAGAAR